MPDLGWLISQLGNPRNVFDILVVALIIYWILWVVQGTRATQLIRGIVTLLVVVFLFGTTFQLTALNWILSQIWPVLLISLPVIFQPEIRRALEQLGQTSSWMPQLRPRSGEQADRVVGELVKAAAQLARHRYGALIVIERETGLQNYVERGVRIDGILTRQLLTNIFYPNSPLHDGAVVVRDGRIVAASVVLPLSENTAATSQLGTRHRAALGIAEQSDAIAIVVSEETGQIAIAENGHLIRNLDTDRLEALLRELLHIDLEARERGSIRQSMQELLRIGPIRVPSSNGSSTGNASTNTNTTTNTSTTATTTTSKKSADVEASRSA